MSMWWLACRLSKGLGTHAGFQTTSCTSHCGNCTTTGCASLTSMLCTAPTIELCLRGSIQVTGLLLLAPHTSFTSLVTFKETHPPSNRGPWNPLGNLTHRGTIVNGVLNNTLRILVYLRKDLQSLGSGLSPGMRCDEKASET
jgi:hypothetical protein